MNVTIYTHDDCLGLLPPQLGAGRQPGDRNLRRLPDSARHRSGAGPTGSGGIPHRRLAVGPGLPRTSVGSSTPQGLGLV